MKKILFIVLVCGLTSNVYATSFVVGVEKINYFPQYSLDKGKWMGYAEAVLSTFAKKKGYQFRYKALPVKRLYSVFLSEEIDFKYPDNPLWKTDEKKGKKIQYSDSVVEFIDGVVVLPEHKDVVSIKSLGIVLGFTPWAFLDDIKAGKITVQESSKFEGIIKKGLAGRVDGVYGNVSVINHTLNKILGKPQGLLLNTTLPYSTDSYFLSTIKNPEVLIEFNQFLEEEKVLIDTLQRKYKVGQYRGN